MTAMTYCFYSIAMNGPSIIIASLGPASLISIVLTVCFELTTGLGLTGVCTLVSVNFFVRYVCSKTSVSCNNNFKEANQARFFRKETFKNLGYQTKLGIGALLLMLPTFWLIDGLIIVASSIGETAIRAQAILRNLVTVLAV